MENDFNYNNEQGHLNGVKYGGFFTRLGAHIIDNLIISIPLGIIAIFIFIVMVSSAPELIDLLSDPLVLAEERTLTDAEAFVMIGFIFKYAIFIGVISLVTTWLYYALLHSSKWQATLGKKLLGIKVVDLTGNKVSFGRATGRFFSKMFLSGILLIGYIIAAITEKQQALHDIIAKTIVIKD